MPAPRLTIQLAALSAAIVTAAGCSGAGAARRAPGPMAPALCFAARPASPVPFPFNRDTTRRGQIVRLGGDHGGVADFENASAADVAALLTEGFLDPAERQNEAPDAWQIFQFLCRHDGVRAFGYAVTPDRTDYRVTLDAIESDDIDVATRADAQRFCADAEADLAERVDCFWD